MSNIFLQGWLLYFSSLHWTSLWRQKRGVTLAIEDTDEDDEGDEGDEDDEDNEDDEDDDDDEDDEDDEEDLTDVTLVSDDIED